MSLRPGSELPVGPGVSRFGVGISWDHSPTIVDIDLQAVIVDDKGAIIDAVYYNNLKALKAAVTHSGDEQTGERSGIDECLWVTFNKLPAHIRAIIFVVAAYNRGHLQDAKNGKIHVFEEQKENEVASFRMEDTSEEVDAVGMLVKSKSGSWGLKVIDEPAQDGRHFIDILEPTLGNLIRGLIPGAPKKQKVAFAMEKGQVMDLPPSSVMRSINAGLGWDVSPSVGKAVDMDVSVVFFSQDGRDLGAVFFGNLQEFGVSHSGDNVTGHGSGDDEVINVNLDQIPANCEQMLFVVNIYTKGVTFDQVSNPYCRVVDQDGSELAKYVLRDGRGQSGLIIARLMREPGDGRWGFQALGSFCRGSMWKDSVPEMRAIFYKSARELQLRAGSTATFADGNSMDMRGGGAPAPVVVQAVPVVTTEGSGCGCVLQ